MKLKVIDLYIVCLDPNSPVGTSYDLQLLKINSKKRVLFPQTSVSPQCAQHICKCVCVHIISFDFRSAGLCMYHQLSSVTLFHAQTPDSVAHCACV